MNGRLSSKGFVLSISAVFLAELSFLAIFYLVLNNGKMPDLQKEPGIRWKPGSVTKERLNFILEINNPEDNTVLFDNSITVSGKTSPQAPVIISAGKETGLQANNKGEFSKVIDLSPGPNKIIVTSFDWSGNTKIQERNVYYSEEKL